MGFLHDGHLSLIDRSKAENDLTIVSIFVNPTQFGQNEDLSTYPRDLESDSRKCEEHGVDILFVPSPIEIYPNGFQTYVSVDQLSEFLCGQSRPGHFRGVATVVLKLFNIIEPTRAYFGTKDYQQLQVISRMVSDLNLGVNVVGCPIFREPDGLAMSSRNSYLNETERKQAICLYEALKIAETTYETGESNPEVFIRKMTHRISDEPDAAIDYVQIVDPQTLQKLGKITDSALAILAVRIGRTRLIDNMLLGKSID